MSVTWDKFKSFNFIVTLWFNVVVRIVGPCWTLCTFVSMLLQDPLSNEEEDEEVPEKPQRAVCNIRK